MVILCKDPKGKNVFKTDNPTQLTGTILSQYSGPSTTSSITVSNTLEKQLEDTYTATQCTMSPVEQDSKDTSN